MTTLVECVGCGVPFEYEGKPKYEELLCARCYGTYKNYTKLEVIDNDADSRESQDSKRN